MENQNDPADLLAAMQAQRDTALNAVVQLQATCAALRRRIKELEEVDIES